MTRKLDEAREHLAKAESMLMQADGLSHLQQGLTLLDDMIGDGSGDNGGPASVATNLGQAYASRIYQRVRQAVTSGGRLPEPELEHLFAVMRAFDDVCFDLPAEAAALKIGVVRQLVDLYYEGFPAEEKEKIYRQLEALSGASGG